MRHFTVALLLACLGTGCQDPAPCYGTDKGFEYDIELLERWDEDSSYARDTSGPYPYGAGCGPDFDVWEGDRVRLRVEAHEFHSRCESAVVSPSAPEEHGWEILTTLRQAGPKMVFIGQFDAVMGECEGLLQLWVEEQRRAPNLYSEPELGELPYFVFGRQFTSEDCETIDQTCGDEFVAEVHPVE